MIQPAKYSVRIFITFRAKILLIPLVTSNIINTLLIFLNFTSMWLLLKIKILFGQLYKRKLQN